MMKMGLPVVVLAVLALVGLAPRVCEGRIVSKCELRDMRMENPLPLTISLDDLAKLLCLGKANSGLNTSLVVEIPAPRLWPKSYYNKCLKNASDDSEKGSEEQSLLMEGSAEGSGSTMEWFNSSSEESKSKKNSSFSKEGKSEEDSSSSEGSSSEDSSSSEGSSSEDSSSSEGSSSEDSSSSEGSSSEDSSSSEESKSKEDSSSSEEGSSEEGSVWTLYGMFQLSDHVMCTSGSIPTLNLCEMDCSRLIDDDIADDIACVTSIIEEIKAMEFCERGDGLEAKLIQQMAELALKPECDEAKGSIFADCQGY